MESKKNSSDSPTHHHQSKKIKPTHQIQTSSDAETPYLVEEIIVEILTRLPVKSLLKFRCVSKSWLSLISSPQFIKSHLKISTKDESVSKYRVMLTRCNLGYDLKHCSVRSLMYEPLTEACNIEYPKESGHRNVQVVGSCNGLVCIATYRKDLFLWNPSIRRSTRLPPRPVKINPGRFNIFGFGYNESTEDYKVLSIFHVPWKGEVCKSVANLYSLKSNSWKWIEDFRGVPQLGDSGKFAGGKLHFSTVPGSGLGTSSDIVFLDLDTETYGMVEQPNYGDGRTASTLGVLGGCISMFCIYQKICADVWVLKEHGIKESWTKVFTIPYINDPVNFFCSKSLFMLPNGEVLLLDWTGLIVYSPKNNCLRRPMISDVFVFVGADVYVESLVSPGGNGD